MPVTASPYFGSRSSIEWPPTIATPGVRGRVGAAAQDRSQRPVAELLERVGHEVQRGERRAAHRVDVGQRVGRGDAPEVVRVVDDRREEVDGRDDRERVRHAVHRGVVGGLVADEQRRVVRARQLREQRMEHARRDLARAAGAVREGGEADGRCHLPIIRGVPERQFTDAEIDAAVEALSDPERFRDAESASRGWRRSCSAILNDALDEGGWFGEAHDGQVLKAATTPDADERIAAVRTLLAEETRIGMMVGVAVGWELRPRARPTRRGDD